MSSPLTHAHTESMRDKLSSRMRTFDSLRHPPSSSPPPPSLSLSLSPSPSATLFSRGGRLSSIDPRSNDTPRTSASHFPLPSPLCIQGMLYKRLLARTHRVSVAHSFILPLPSLPIFPSIFLDRLPSFYPPVSLSLGPRLASLLPFPPSLPSSALSSSSTAMVNSPLPTDMAGECRKASHSLKSFISKCHLYLPRSSPLPHLSI